MKIVPQSFTIDFPSSEAEWLAEFKRVERAYRTCYKSEGKMTKDSWQTFIPEHINHESPLEHAVVSVVIVCSRAIAQELTRHRIASYSIESTRWIDYFKRQGGSVDFVEPTDWNEFTHEQQGAYLDAMRSSEEHYNRLRALGLKAQRARDAFSLGLKGEIYCTMNVSSWRHVFRERYFNPAAHPDMRVLTGGIFKELVSVAPVFFSDLGCLPTSTNF